MDKTYDPKKVEDKIYRKWERGNFFTPSDSPLLGGRTQKVFSIAMAPPNITGSLHMGHALEYTISDILVRYKRVRGYRTLWIPGTDHAGIATQNAVEKQLKKRGLSRYDLGREKFLEEVWKWKKKYGDTIVNQLKKLGASADWSRLRFTMDKQYQKAVAAAFLHYYQKGWIYRDWRTISWCPRCQTSLSDLELEHREEDAELYYIKYGPLVLATVRPETKFGDTALAVHPKDKRYQKYIGKELEVESLDVRGMLDQPKKTKIKIKVVADKAVDPRFGTGVVKVTPAHDLTDYEIYLRHHLPITQVIDERGKMNENAGKYAGMKTADARIKIAEDLRATGLLVKEEPYRHNVAVCSRCQSVIEPLPSRQWFLKMDKLANKAKRAVKSGEVKIIPKNFERPYFNWLNNIHDWTISRQIWWGHQLPVFFCKRKQGVISNFQFPISKQIPNSIPIPSPDGYRDQIPNSSTEQFLVSLKKPRKCPFCEKCQMEQSPDVLDTWFSSALWPFAVLGWPKKTKDLKNFYPTSVNTNDRGIINLWDARMIFSGLEFMKKIPFKNNIIHATILTKDGKRMSKSLGTGIDPLELIEKYGADAVRFGIIWQTMGNQDIRWDETAVLAGKKFANKLWNIARFVLSARNQSQNINLMGLRNPLIRRARHSILAQLKKTKIAAEKDIENYQFGRALRRIYDFVWHDFADKYIEQSKIAPQNGAKQETQKVLAYCLRDIIKILHPFMPFVTEELYGKMSTPYEIERKRKRSRFRTGSKKLLIIEKW